MQKKNKTLVFGFFSACAAMFFAFCAIVWFVDPFRLFHKPFMCENQIYDDMRYNAKGLIDYTDFDSIIIGTSMLANTSSKEANALLGGKFLNLSIWGSSLEQRAIVMDYALAKKPLKKIIISLDRGSFTLGDTSNGVPTERFDFLYTGGWIEFFKIYLNTQYVAKILSFSCEEEANMDMPSSWMQKWQSGVAKRFGGIKNWAKSYQDKEIITTAQVISLAVEKAQSGYKPENKLELSYFRKFKKDIDKNVLKFARKFPQTEFILVIPPYSMLQNAILRFNSDGYSILQKELIKYILSQNLKNVKIYAFDNMDFTQNIANYMDLGHYTPQINSKMLELIANDKARLNLDNIDKWWQEFDFAVSNYNFIEVYNELIAQIQKQKEIDAKKM